MMPKLLTISKRRTHSSRLEPNGLSVVIQDVHAWALREGWKHAHLGLGIEGQHERGTPHWIFAELLPADLYDYYSHNVISDYVWPMLHGMPAAAADSLPDLVVWDVVGERLASRAMGAELEAGDQIWVHDFQALPAVPALSRAQPRPRIGYFQHAPLSLDTMDASVAARFTHYLAHADIVAVQTPDDAEAARTLGVDPHRIAVAPVCVSASIARGENPANPNDRLSILIAGRCDPTKGHALGIEAVERTAVSSTIPIDLVVHAPPSRTGSSRYGPLRDAIAATAEHARAVLTRYGGSLQLHDQVLPVRHLRRIMRHANCLLVPSFADGMNLVAKEYVVERGSAASRIVLTSRTGARYSLPGAFVAADSSVDSVAETLEKAIQTNPGEIAARWQENRSSILMEVPSRWMEALTNTLRDST